MLCKVEKVESRSSKYSQKSANCGDDFGHKMDLETSSRPLGTTIFEEFQDEASYNSGWGWNRGLRMVYKHIYDVL